MELAPRLEEYLRRFDRATSVEVRENGHRVTTVEKLSWEVRGAAAKPLLSIRSEQYNVTHSVVAIRADSNDRLALAVERFGNPRPGRLEFRRMDFIRPNREIARQDFCPRLARIFSERFPDESVENLKIGPDLEHSISGNYARGVLRSGIASWALLAVPDGETPATSENSLTAGLLWLARVRETSHKGFVTGLKLIVAKGTSSILVHLAKALSSSIALEIYELDPRNELLIRIDPNALANQNTWLVPSRERQSLLDHAAPAIDPIVAISPKAITLHPNTRAGDIVLRFRGLAFARWKNDVVFFGADLRKKLVSSSQSDFKHVLHDLELHRHPLATDTRHSLYRAQPERWLEAIVRSDVSRVDASLDPRFVYTQLFASSATERGILDVLAVTTSGRLAIIELKTSEHIHLPLQAAEYWLRIRHHLERGDFSRNGYFPQLQLQSAPPLVFLVAPALHFHSTTDLLLRHLSQSIEVVRVGIAETWRRGLRVVMRQ